MLISILLMLISILLIFLKCFLVLSFKIYFSESSCCLILCLFLCVRWNCCLCQSWRSSHGKTRSVLWSVCAVLWCQDLSVFQPHRAQKCQELNGILCVTCTHLPGSVLWGCSKAVPGLGEHGHQIWWSRGCYEWPWDWAKPVHQFWWEK